MGTTTSNADNNVQAIINFLMCLRDHISLLVLSETKHDLKSIVISVKEMKPAYRLALLNTNTHCLSKVIATFLKQGQ